MQIPRFWARADQRVLDAHGRRFSLRIWGWSDDDDAAAQRVAEERLAEVEARLARGEPFDSYFYGQRPMREEIVRRLGSPGGVDEAIVTRNRYGALVLNTACVPFVDVDLDPAALPAPVRGGWLGRLFGGGAGSAPPAAPDAALERLRDACRRHPDRTFRVYRTCAGFRLLATDGALDPAGEETEALLLDLGADPRFILLCRVQRCFRARLTPKPWRCDLPLPPGAHPRDAVALARFESWLARYERASEGHATCRWLETLGPGRVSPLAAPVVAEHDRVARVDADLPLA